MKLIPELNKEYHIFDDGKIRPSRHFKCTVTEIIPFGECYDTALLKAWERDVAECFWLFDEETDYFIKAVSDFSEYPLYFARTIEGWWFSIDYPNPYMGAILDIDGSLYAKLIKWYGEGSIGGKVKAIIERIF